MLSLSLFLGLFASITSSLAAATPPSPSAPLYKYDGQVNQGSYIVKLKDGTPQSTLLSFLTALFGAGSLPVTRQYSPEFYNAFSGLSTPPCSCVYLNLTSLPQGISITNLLPPSWPTRMLSTSRRMVSCRHSIAGIPAFTVHRIMSLNQSVRNDEPWNLARISTPNKLSNQDPYALTNTYNHLANPGNGVDIYVVDTGLSFPVRSINVSQYLRRYLYPTCTR